MEHEKQEPCDNCHKLFPESKVNSHYSYCRRNIRKCQHCAEFIDINYQQEHNQEFHAKSACKWCSKSMAKSELESHQQNCLQKPKRCDYCETEVKRLDYDRHVADCGSRTKLCPVCSKNIVLREYEFHTEVCTGRETQPSMIAPVQQRPDYYTKPVLRDQYRKPESYQTISIPPPVVSNQYNAVPQSGIRHNFAQNAYQPVQQASSIRQPGSVQPQSTIQSAVRMPEQSGLIHSNDPALRPGVKVTYPTNSLSAGFNPSQASNLRHQISPSQVYQSQEASKLQATNLATHQQQKVTVSYNPVPVRQILDDELDEDTEVQKAILQNIQKAKAPPVTYTSQHRVVPNSYQNIQASHYYQPKPTESGLSRHLPTANTFPTGSHVSHTTQSNLQPHGHIRHAPSIDTSGEDLLNTSFYGDLEFQQQIEASLKKDHHHHHHHHH